MAFFWRLDLALDAFLFGQRALALELDLRALCRVVAGGEVGPERVDLALQGVGVHLIALERQPRVGHLLPPGLLVLLALRLLVDGLVAGGGRVGRRRRRGGGAGTAGAGVRC